MRRVSTALLAIATVWIPVLATTGHAANDLRPTGRTQDLVATGHEKPDPAIHLEAQSGTVEVHCPGCVLDKRQQGQTEGAGPCGGAQTVGLRGHLPVVAHRSLERPDYRSPRGPPQP